MKKIFVLICATLFTTLLFATDFTATTPQEAVTFLNKASAGDKVILKNGTYTDAVVKFSNKNGTEKSPIIFTAETPGQVFFEGNSYIVFGGNYVTVQGFTFQNGGFDLEKKSILETNKESKYCTIQDCYINNYNITDKMKDNKWVSVNGEYNTVTRCTFNNKVNLGTLLVVWLVNGQPAHHTITYNYFLKRGNATTENNGFESIRIGTSQTSMTNAQSNPNVLKLEI